MCKISSLPCMFDPILYAEERHSFEKFRSGHSWSRFLASLPGQSHRRGGS